MFKYVTKANLIKIGLVLLIPCIVFLIYYFIEENNKWNKFCNEHYFYNPGDSKTNPYYQYGAKKFETKSEAIDYCVTSFKNL